MAFPLPFKVVNFTPFLLAHSLILSLGKDFFCSFFPAWTRVVQPFRYYDTCETKELPMQTPNYTLDTPGRLSPEESEAWSDARLLQLQIAIRWQRDNDLPAAILPKPWPVLPMMVRLMIYADCGNPLPRLKLKLKSLHVWPALMKPDRKQNSWKWLVAWKQNQNLWMISSAMKNPK